MPEGTEIDIERLQETIHEPPTDSLLRNIALTTALLAAFGAVASLQAGGTVNEALVLKTEAGRLQAEASDQWTSYQAKGIKASVQEASRATWIAAGKAAPAYVDQSIQRYAVEQKDIEHAAREKERERDDKSEQADRLQEILDRVVPLVAVDPEHSRLCGPEGPLGGPRGRPGIGVVDRHAIAKGRASTLVNRSTTCRRSPESRLCVSAGSSSCPRRAWHLPVADRIAEPLPNRRREVGAVHPDDARVVHPLGEYHQTHRSGRSGTRGKTGLGTIGGEAIEPPIPKFPRRHRSARPRTRDRRTTAWAGPPGAPARPAAEAAACRSADRR